MRSNSECLRLASYRPSFEQANFKKHSLLPRAWFAKQLLGLFVLLLHIVPTSAVAPTFMIESTGVYLKKIRYCKQIFLLLFIIGGILYFLLFYMFFVGEVSLQVLNADIVLLRCVRDACDKIQVENNLRHSQ